MPLEDSSSSFPLQPLPKAEKLKQKLLMLEPYFGFIFLCMYFWVYFLNVCQAYLDSKANMKMVENSNSTSKPLQVKKIENAACPEMASNPHKCGSAQWAGWRPLARLHPVSRTYFASSICIYYNFFFNYS